MEERPRPLRVAEIPRLGEVLLDLPLEVLDLGLLADVAGDRAHVALDLDHPNGGLVADEDHGRQQPSDGVAVVVVDVVIGAPRLPKELRDGLSVPRLELVEKGQPVRHRRSLRSAGFQATRARAYATGAPPATGPRTLFTGRTPLNTVESRDPPDHAVSAYQREGRRCSRTCWSGTTSGTTSVRSST